MGPTVRLDADEKEKPVASTTNRTAAPGSFGPQSIKDERSSESSKEKNKFCLSKHIDHGFEPHARHKI